MLERVRYSDYRNGIDMQALTDGYAYDGYFSLYLLSVAGHDSSVKGITSALVSGRKVEILSDGVIELGTSFMERYRILSTKLPGPLLHQVVLAERFFNDRDGRERLLYVDPGENPARLVYEAVRNGCPVPVIPEWSDWLYGRLRQENFVEDMHGTRHVLRLSLQEEELDSMISEGVRNGEITF